MIDGESSKETSEKVVKRLNDEDYLFVPRSSLEEADTFDSTESKSETKGSETGLDSNEEFDSRYRTNRKAFLGRHQSKPISAALGDKSDPQKSVETEITSQNILETPIENLTELHIPFHESDITTEDFSETPIENVTTFSPWVIGETLAQRDTNTVTDLQGDEDRHSTTHIMITSEFTTTDNEDIETTEKDTETTEKDKETTEKENETTEKDNETTIKDLETTERDIGMTALEMETTENLFNETIATWEPTEPTEERATFEEEAEESTASFNTESQTEPSIQSQDSVKETKKKKRRVVKKVKRKHTTIVKTTKVKTKKSDSSDEDIKKRIKDEETTASQSDEDTKPETIAYDSNEHENELANELANIDFDSNENKSEATDGELGDDSTYYSEEYKTAGDGFDYYDGN